MAGAADVKTGATRSVKRSAKPSPEVARALYEGLQKLHPDAHCELDHASAFQLLVATVLSAQTTDKLVNKVTPHLFAGHGDAKSLAAADVAVIEAILRDNGLGMYRQKSKNIVGLARALVEKHGGEVPRSMDALVELPGVGRKTANVVLGVTWGTPEGVVVDTHVMRLSQRLGLTKKTTPEEIEPALCELFPREQWDPLSHLLIFHGRRICFAIKPACATCGLSGLCPSAFNAENVGRKSRPQAAPKAKASKKPAATKPSATKPKGMKKPPVKAAKPTSASAARADKPSGGAAAAKRSPKR